MPDRTPSRKPTAAELRDINNRFSRSQLSSSDIVVLDRIHLANGYQLAHGMYFIDPISSLARMAQQINGSIDAKPVHLHIAHNVRMTLGLGTFFSASMEENDSGPVLSGKVYILKDMQSGGFDSNSLISAYDAGIWEDISIGQDWSSTVFRCDVCGNDILGGDCTHLYDLVFGIPLRDGSYVTFTVENALLNETSAVWRGALSDAGVGKLGLDISSMGSVPETPTQERLAESLFGAQKVQCEGLTCSAHRCVEKSGLPSVLFAHTSSVSKGEPVWKRLIRDQRKFLPDNAFADEKNRMFPHHWVENGKVGLDGRFVDGVGEMRLHHEGMMLSLSMATEEDDAAIRDHLSSHVAESQNLDDDDDIEIAVQKALTNFNAVVSTDGDATGEDADSDEDNDIAGILVAAAKAAGENGTDNLEPTMETPMKTKEQLLEEVSDLSERLDAAVTDSKIHKREVDKLKKELSLANDALNEAAEKLEELESRLAEHGKDSVELKAIKDQLADAGIPDPTPADLKRLSIDVQAAITRKDTALAEVNAKIDDLSGEAGMSDAEAKHYRELAEHISVNSLSHSAAADKLEKLAENLDAEFRFLGVKPGRTAESDDAPDQGEGENLSEEREARRNRFKAQR